MGKTGPCWKPIELFREVGPYEIVRFTFKNKDEIYGCMYLFDKDSTDGEITPKLYGSDDFLCMPCINKKEKQKEEV